LRKSVKGFPLVKVTFKNLRDLEEDQVVEVRDWYVSLFERDSYKSLLKLYKEADLDVWLRKQKLYPHLAEYQKLKYRLEVFRADFRRTMPESIKRKVVKDVEDHPHS
jgi:sulfatase maturation enzyme AslB (radical SAM superfamily)